MDRWMDQQAYFPIEMQFFIFVMFLGFPDKIHEEKPSFLDFENNWLRTHGPTDRPTDGPTDGPTDALMTGAAVAALTDRNAEGAAAKQGYDAMQVMQAACSQPATAHFYLSFYF